MKYHTPVLVNEINRILKPIASITIIDATLGNAGHTINFLNQGATVFGLDKDIANLHIATDRINQLKLSKNFTAISANFKDILKIYSQQIKIPIDAVLFDLGLSINQQKSLNRGFSFNDNLSLDMRLDSNQSNLTAQHIINTYPSQQLFQIFSIYGQEIHSQLITNAIVKTRKLKSFTSAKTLADFIVDLFKKNHLYFGKIHPATKVFLALKIAVNHELDNLTTALDSSLKIIKTNGWILIITFHSTEDRLVKEFIKKSKFKGLIKTSLKIKPSFLETKQNPLSRSALLRAFQKA